MRTNELISPEQYLAIHYEREPEYVRGEIRERPMPDAIHAWIQRVLLLMFIPAKHALIALPELGCRVAPDLYRLPDVAVLLAGERIQRVPSTPPLGVIEIVSREEHHVELGEKLRDYHAWGVPHIWVVDSWLKRLCVWSNNTLVPIDALSLPAHNFEVRLSHLLDGMPVEE
jgi:Uma2 family endonuclease